MLSYFYLVPPLLCIHEHGMIPGSLEEKDNGKVRAFVQISPFLGFIGEDNFLFCSVTLFKGNLKSN